MIALTFFSNYQMEDMDGEPIYSGIIQVVKFIYKYICFQNASWIRCFGRLTWPRISELVISSFLSKVCFSKLFKSELQSFSTFYFVHKVLLIERA